MIELFPRGGASDWQQHGSPNAERTDGRTVDSELRLRTGSGRRCRTRSEAQISRTGWLLLLAWRRGGEQCLAAGWAWLGVGVVGRR